MTNTVTNTFTPRATDTKTSTPTLTVTDTPTAPLVPVIRPPWPNPSNGTPISFTVQALGQAVVTMDVFTLTFRKVASQTLPMSGTQTILWDLRDIMGVQVANGLYYVRIQVAGVQSSTKILKVLVLR
jgi:hypothetical protein